MAHLTIRRLRTDWSGVRGIGVVMCLAWFRRGSGTMTSRGLTSGCWSAISMISNRIPHQEFHFRPAAPDRLCRLRAGDARLTGLWHLFGAISIAANNTAV
jgi:hypothetical protein